MKILKQAGEIVVIFIIIYFAIHYLLPPETITETVTEIDTLFVTHTIYDTQYVTVATEIDTIYIDDGEHVSASLTAKTTQTFQKQGVYSAVLSVFYNYDTEEFDISFDIEVQKDTVYVYQTDTVTKQKPKRWLSGLIGGYVSEEPGVTGHIGVSIKEKIDIYLGVHNNATVGVGLNYRF